MKLSRLFASAALVAALSIPLAAQQGSRIGPSGGEVAGAAVGVGAAVAVVVFLAVNHGHHSITGCVVSAANGLELRTGDSRAWALEGDTSDLKVGDRVKVHGSRDPGSRGRKAKGAPAPDVFNVDKLNKDYGACHERPPAPAAAR